ncbi:hypothetical protein PRIPAC_86169 [Pristionchus pacificus]|uniref:Uncharacterized protein n=1 Tax=Pristionchus pacificus TaxID=54126 RepID=A0A2A6BMD7_PRIPA|nr:hypothetical protein PRIPAC_86169 [Pristionchus pacificus]|eukprot:PDM67069.1 hypothetical protein PRIPAC_48486 [Pristionchus pacificus]
MSIPACVLHYLYKTTRISEKIHPLLSITSSISMELLSKVFLATLAVAAAAAGAGKPTEAQLAKMRIVLNEMNAIFKTFNLNATLTDMAKSVVEMGPRTNYWSVNHCNDEVRDKHNEIVQKGGAVCTFHLFPAMN